MAGVWTGKALLWCAGPAVVLAGWIGLHLQGPVAAGARGTALFEGRTTLQARLVGHDQDLPALATRCANCHEAGARGPRYAAALDAAALATPRPRRGGPPSAYDAARLCRLLREGLDPAHVIISTSMPRYTVTDEQCRDLWTYLGQR